MSFFYDHTDNKLKFKMQDCIRGLDCNEENQPNHAVVFESTSNPNPIDNSNWNHIFLTSLTSQQIRNFR